MWFRYLRDRFNALCGHEHSLVWRAQVPAQGVSQNRVLTGFEVPGYGLTVSARADVSQGDAVSWVAHVLPAFFDLSRCGRSNSMSTVLS